jgi:uncharacterized Fe-S cluster-containing radical SAM superfamily protein
MPLSVSISLGYDCNADCLHCDEGRVRRPHRIPESLLRDVVEIAVPNGLLECEIVGGEPLLYKETESIAAAVEARNPDCRLKLLTNGMLLDERWERRAARGRVAVKVSLDGATKSTFERVRGKLDFDRITGNLRRLHEAARDNPRWEGIAVNFVIMEPNKHEIVPLVELGPQLGITNIHFNLLENPFAHPDLEAIDPARDRDTAAAILIELRKAAKLAAELGITFTSRAEPRLLNAFPSLCQTAEDARKLPVDLQKLLICVGRKDMVTRERLTEEDIERLTELQATGAKRDRSVAGAGEYRHIPLLNEDFEADNREGLTYLRSLSAGAGRLCDYPFTILYLDTYRTYVCCQATDKYLYGHRYDSATPRLADVWNGPFMQSARAKMYEGDFDAVCHSRCVYYAGGGTCETLKDGLERTGAGASIPADSIEASVHLGRSEH